MDTLYFRPSFYCVVCVLLYGRGEGSSDRSAVSPKFTPSEIIVQYGHEFSVNCSMCENGSCYSKIKWEAPGGIKTKLETSENGVNETILQWRVQNVTEWAMRPLCCLLKERPRCSILSVTLYKPPDNVSISFVNHNGPLIEGRQYTLQCHVQDVAPVQNLTVSFYRGDNMLGRLQSSTNPVATPVTETFTHSVNSSRDHNGAQYWCEAVLNLGPHGPQPPPVRSDRLTATVHFKPTMVAAPQPDPISITEGDFLQLDCTADSNPSPSYSWTAPDNATNVSGGSVLNVSSAGQQHGGQYVCVASNERGSARVVFNVSVNVDLLPIFAGLAALVLVLAMVLALFLYKYYYRHTKIRQYRLRDVFRRAGILEL